MGNENYCFMKKNCETKTAWKLKYFFRNYILSLWTAIACITAKLFFLGINWKLGPLSVIRIHTTKRHSSYELTATLLWLWLWSFQFDNLIRKMGFKRIESQIDIKHFFSSQVKQDFLCGIKNWKLNVDTPSFKNQLSYSWRDCH